LNSTVKRTVNVYVCFCSSGLVCTGAHYCSNKKLKSILAD
jgi:hypothetical protein